MDRTKVLIGSAVGGAIAGALGVGLVTKDIKGASLGAGLGGFAGFGIAYVATPSNAPSSPAALVRSGGPLVQLGIR